MGSKVIQIDEFPDCPLFPIIIRNKLFQWNSKWIPQQLIGWYLMAQFNHLSFINICSHLFLNYLREHGKQRVSITGSGKNASLRSQGQHCFALARKPATNIKLFSHPFDGIHQPICRGIMAADWLRFCQFRQNLFSQLFAQFHAHLVKRVDIPDDALGEDFVLIEGNQRTQHFRRQFWVEEGIGRTVARESFGLDEHFQTVASNALLAQFRPRLIGCLALHQGFGLGQVVGEQDRVMLTQRVVAVGGRQEVTRDELGALVDELVKGVLAIGAGLTPDNRAGGIADRLSLQIHTFAVAFHVPLLEVGGEVQQVLVVRQNSMRADIIKIVIPNTQQSHDHRDVALKRGSAEVKVGFVRPGK